MQLKHVEPSTLHVPLQGKARCPGTGGRCAGVLIGSRVAESSLEDLRADLGLPCLPVCSHAWGSQALPLRKPSHLVILTLVLWLDFFSFWQRCWRVGKWMLLVFSRGNTDGTYSAVNLAVVLATIFSVPATPIGDQGRGRRTPASS